MESKVDFSSTARGRRLSESTVICSIQWVNNLFTANIRIKSEVHNNNNNVMFL